MKVSIGNYPSRGKRRENVRVDKYDTFSLDHTLALIIAPCLKEFSKVNNGHPGKLTSEEWDVILGKMLWSMEEIVKDEPELDSDEEHQRKIQEGLELFGKWYRHLWW